MKPDEKKIITRRSSSRRHDATPNGWAWVRQTLYRMTVPGGLLLLVSGVLGAVGIFSGPATARVAAYCPYIIFGAGLLLSAVFRRSRLFFAFLGFSLAQIALAWIIPTQGSPEVRRVMLDAIAFLLPINLVILALVGDRGIVSPAGRRWLASIAAQACGVAALCWPGVAHMVGRLDKDFLPAGLTAWSRISSPGLVVFAVAAIVLAVCMARRNRSVESSMAWSMVAAFLALQAGTNGLAAVYFSTAGLVLMIAVVETSYAMAYRDELTQLPSRRALNEALLQMGDWYTLAMVDVDHFKKFNDTYGHEAGDHALRLVASRLAGVTGGGRAYRYGGEEFAVVFPGKSAEEAGASLERLRRTIAQSSFIVRGQDRRKKTGKGWRNGEKETSVTVSIGLAERTDYALSPHDVLKLADKALYRAKAKGRNCTVAARRARTSAGTRALAS